MRWKERIQDQTIKKCSHSSLFFLLLNLFDYSLAAYEEVIWEWAWDGTDAKPFTESSTRRANTRAETEKRWRERDNKQNQNRRQYYLTIRYRKRKNTTKLLSSIWQEQRKRNVFDLFSFLAWAVLLLGEPIYFLSHCIYFFYFYIFFLPINVFLFACSII